MIKLMSKQEIKSFWYLNKQHKQDMLEQFIAELPTLRAKVGISQEDIANTIGISRQTYGAYENGDRLMPWSIYLTLLFYFDYIPATHRFIRILELFPTEFDECWLTAKMSEQGENE